MNSSKEEYLKSLPFPADGELVCSSCGRRGANVYEYYDERLVILCKCAEVLDWEAEKNVLRDEEERRRAGNGNR